jgi:hypothetical protein
MQAAAGYQLRCDDVALNLVYPRFNSARDTSGPFGQSDFEALPGLWARENMMGEAYIVDAVRTPVGARRRTGGGPPG